MSETMTQNSYWEEIASIVDSIRDISEDTPGAELSEILHETVDAHEWVIYTGYHFDVLRFTNNDAYMVSNFGSDGLIQGGQLNTAALAFWALYADVQEHSDYAALEEALSTP